MSPALSALALRPFPLSQSHLSTQENGNRPGTHLTAMAARPWDSDRVLGGLTGRASLRGHRSQEGGRGRGRGGASRALGKRLCAQAREEAGVAGGADGAQCVRRLNFLAKSKGISCAL